MGYTTSGFASSITQGDATELLVEVKLSAEEKIELDERD